MITKVTSTKNQYIKLCHALISGKQSDFFIIASQKLISESAPYYQPVILIGTNKELLEQKLSVKVKILISHSLFASFKLGTRKDEIIAIYKVNLQKDRKSSEHHDQLILILDRIQNTSNLGLILRTAYAFGVTSIYFTPGSCSPYSYKAIAAARVPNIFCFSFFHLSISQLGEILKRNNYYVIEAVAQKNLTNSPMWQSRNSDNHKIALIMGSEGCGISPSLAQYATHSMTIETPIFIHSLNVGVAFALLICDIVNRTLPISNQLAGK